MILKYIFEGSKKKCLRTNSKQSDHFDYESNGRLMDTVEKDTNATFCLHFAKSEITDKSS